MKEQYLEIIALTEQLHRLFLAVVTREMERLDVHDINCVQLMIMYNLGTGQVSASDLITRGLYNGSNPSYNIKKIAESGYISQTRSKYDKRHCIIKLSPKGMNICKKLDEIFSSHILKLKDGTTISLSEIADSLKNLKAFWSNVAILGGETVLPKRLSEQTRN